MRVNLRCVLLTVSVCILVFLLVSVYKTVNPEPPNEREDTLVTTHASPPSTPSPKKTGHEGSDQTIAVDETLALHFKKKVRVLVWVMTSPQTKSRAIAVNSTWATRTDRNLLVYMSSMEDKSLPTVALQVKEGRGHLTAKTMQAFDYIYKNYFDKADFFMKADDDTYVVMENLRYFLSFFDTKEPFLTGRHFKNKVKQGFTSGGAGYVLSKEALRRLAGRTKDPPMCKEDGPEEDVELGRCLEKLGVRILNSSDSKGRSRFHPFRPVQHVITGMGGGYQHYDANVVRIGTHAINEFPITFHYISPNDMRMMHFFLYHVRPYGITHRFTGS